MIILQRKENAERDGILQNASQNYRQLQTQWLRDLPLVPPTITNQLNHENEVVHINPLETPETSLDTHLEIETLCHTNELLDENLCHKGELLDEGCFCFEKSRQQIEFHVDEYAFPFQHEFHLVKEDTVDNPINKSHKWVKEDKRNEPLSIATVYSAPQHKNALVIDQPSASVKRID